jgi:hemerythrin-like domain-containing protein
MDRTAQQLEKEHDALRQQQQRLIDCSERYRRRPSRDNVLAFRDLFEAFGRCLDRHLDYEEDGGYLEHVRDRRPRYSSEVDRLLLEHGEMRKRVVALVGTLNAAAETVEEVPPTFFEDFAALMQLCATHESTERELIMDAFWRDGGRSRSGLEQ